MPAIAVVGAGFSGTLAAYHLLRELPADWEVHVIDATGTFGPGLAYGTQDPSHILNVPVAGMSAFEADPLHFYRWLQVRRPGTEAGQFVERSWYGRYLSELLLSADDRQVPRLHMLTDEVVSLHDLGQQPLIGLRSGAFLRCNAVVLALGNFPPSHKAATRSLPSEERQIKHFWRSPTWSRMDPDASVLILGTGLSMVDAVLSLRRRQHRGRIVALSRRGLLPRPHADSSERTLVLPAPPFTVLDLLRRFRAAVRDDTDPLAWIGLIHSLRPRSREIWQGLSAVEKQRFQRHVSPYWEVHRHRMPASSRDALQELVEEGQLSIVAGRLQAVVDTGTGLAISYRNRDRRLCKVSSQYFIDCSGSERRVAHAGSSLLSQLLAERFVAPDALGAGLRVDDVGRCWSPRQSSVPIYALGSLRRGTVGESSAVRELRDQARQFADAFVQEHASLKPEALRRESRESI